MTFDGHCAMSISQSDLQRFWSKVNKRGPIQDHMDDRCWEWTGAKNADGYGRFSLRSKSSLAHRFSFLLATGDEPEQVLHRCNNRSCVRPNHLAAGDCKDNLIDLLLRRVRQSDEVA